MRYLVYIFLLSLSVFILSGCKDNNDTTPAKLSSGLYIAGSYNNSPAYWVDDKITMLSPSFDGQVTDMALTESEIFLAGNSTENKKIFYWKNGTPVLLGNGTDNRSVSGIAVSGSDVYITAWNFTTSAGELWKNDQVTVLSAEGHTSTASDVLVANGNVYVAGNLDGKATLWTNGTPATLSEEFSNATALFIDVNDIYVGGVVQGPVSGEFESNNAAVYWKNGSIVWLNDFTTDSYVGDIAVSGSDVYVGAGVGIPPQATLFKNGVPGDYLTVYGNYGSINAITFKGTSIIAGGHDQNGTNYINQAKYWIDGEEVDLVQEAGVSAVINSLIFLP